MSLRLLLARVRAGIEKINNEPAAVVAGAIAAINAVTVNSWKAYGAALVAFLVRFALGGPDTVVAAKRHAAEHPRKHQVVKAQLVSPHARAGVVVAAALALTGGVLVAKVTSSSAGAAITCTSTGTTVAPAVAADPTIPAGFPNGPTTGVKAGTPLTKCNGFTISTCGALDGKEIDGDLTVTATNGTTGPATPCVTVTNTIVRGQLLMPKYLSCSGLPCVGPVVINDSEVAYQPIANNLSGLGTVNYYAAGDDIHGGRIGLNCDGFCTISDSYVHDEGAIPGAHVDGFISNGDSNTPLVLNHNTFVCNVAAGANAGTAGCSGAINFFGDNSSSNGAVVTNNFIGSGDASYCAYTGASQPSKSHPASTGLNWTGNVWQHTSTKGGCGQYGPVADWSGGGGNVWCNNKWSDGGFVAPAAENCSTTPTTVATSTSSTLRTTTTVTVPPTSTLPSSTTTIPRTTTTAPASSTTVPPVTTTIPVTTTTACLDTKPRVCTISG